MRVAAVSFLNTVPLVWGFLRGPQQGLVDLTFDVPSVCADRLATGVADVGIVPCAELDPLGLDFLSETGIACRGPVRSILLVSKVPLRRIRSLAADASSRTSVMLTRVLLAEKYGVVPEWFSHAPVLEEMLANADAALVIGDPALRIEPAVLPYECLDLGEEWWSFTGLPMVFAVWAGRSRFINPETRRLFRDSCEYGLSRLDEIIDSPGSRHGFSPEVAREYLTRYIRFRLGADELAGLDAFRKYAATFRARDAELTITSA
jgi:chorismate dehydratase